MVRSIAPTFVGLALTVALAGTATAQSVPTGPLPGSGDSAKISAGNRENNAEYNHLISTADPKAPAKDDHATTKSTPVAATAADITVGSGLRDVNGVRIGTVSEVDADGVVVDTGTTKIKVPASGFGKDSGGLLLNVTAARFNELVAKAHAGH